MGARSILVLGPASWAASAKTESPRIIYPMLYPPTSDGDGRKITTCSAHSLPKLGAKRRERGIDLTYQDRRCLVVWIASSSAARPTSPTTMGPLR